MPSKKSATTAAATTSDKKTSKKASKAVEEPKVEKPKVEETKVEQPAEDTKKKTETYENLSMQVITNIQATINSLRSNVTLLRDMKRAHDRELREAAKNRRKAKNAEGKAKRPLSGFAVPSPITDELADFLNKEMVDILKENDVKVARGCSLSRTMVTRLLNMYFVKKNLQEPKNRRNINPNEPLRKLLHLKQGDIFNYFQLQTLLTPHFLKKDKAAVPVPVSA
jgi:hypothetical protein